MPPRHRSVPRRTPSLAAAVVVACALGPPLAAQQLFDVVERLAGENNPTRVTTVTEILVELGLTPTFQDFEHEANGNTVQGRNVLVRLEGSLPGRPTVVVGAHLDAAPLRDGGLSQGAVDNAAGTSIVIHLAGRLSERTLRHDFVFALFDLEELGLVGSRHFVERLGEDTAVGGTVKAMVNVDIGSSGEAIIFGPRAASGNDHLYTLADRLCGERGADCLDFDNYPPSDERSFQAASIANISFAVVPEIEAHQLWLRFHGGQESGLLEGFLPETARIIHTAEDRSERVDEASLRILLDYLEAYLLALDAELGAGSAR